METTHRIINSDSRNLASIADNSIDLVVTSPPYPMIQMWDELFSTLSSKVKNALADQNGDEAFQAMHNELDKVWNELFKVTREGAYVCINIGDATRTVGNNFQLYSNHSRIINSCKKIGFNTLPNILWRKQTNAPNKFMGSGMLPGGAYVTLEHEYILIFRKGGKKPFNTQQQKTNRQESAYFWEERNCWFSDLWNFKGAGQKLKNSDTRSRSAAFPFDLAYRLINMYSSYGDTVLDPFVGTGTTSQACLACARNSLGVEIDPSLASLIFAEPNTIIDIDTVNRMIYDRIQAHIQFVKEFSQKKEAPKHTNANYNFPVITQQETVIKFQQLEKILKTDYNTLRAFYKTLHASSPELNGQFELTLRNP